MTTTTKLWTKDFTIIIFSNFFLYLTYYLLISIVAENAAEKYNASSSIAGLLAGIFVIGALIGRLLSGSTIEKIGHKKMLTIGFIFYLFTTFLYFFAINIPIFFIIRLFHGMAFGFCSTATGAIAAELIPDLRRGEGTGYYGLSMTLASAIGPFVGMLLMNLYNFNTNLVFCLVSLTIGLTTIIPIKVIHNKSLTDLKQKQNNTTFFNKIIEKKALPVSFIAALICLAYSSVLSFLSSYTSAINMSNIGTIFFVVYSIAIIVSRPFVGKLFDKKGANLVIYPTFIIFSLALILLGSGYSGLIILFSGILMGFGYGNFFSCGQALAIKESPEDKKALATSTYFIFADIGVGFGPFILGFIISAIGYHGLYFTMSVFILLTGIIYFIFYSFKKTVGNFNKASNELNND